MIAVLLDEGLAPNTAQVLREAGFDALHVAEVGLYPLNDAAIIEYARREGRACFTLDQDFHAYLARAGYTRPSVVLIRAEGINSVRQAELIRNVLETCSGAIECGSAISMDESTIRIHPLPLRRS